MYNALSFTRRFLVRLPVLFSAALMVSACGLGIDDEARMQRAQVAYEKLEYTAAIIDLKNVLQNSPDDAVARKMLGLAQAANGEVESAVMQFQRAMDLGQPLNEYRVPFVAALLAAGQQERALDLADPIAAEIDREAFELWLLRGDAFAELGATIDALRSYASGRVLDVNNAPAYLRSAEIFWGQGNYRDALAFTKLALKSDPEYVNGHLTLGAILLDLKEYEEAEEVFAHAISTLDLDSDDKAYFLAYVAESHLAQGDLDAAQAAAVQVAEIWPADDPDMRYLHGQIALAREDYDSAATDMQAYLVDFPESEPALRMLGEALFRRGMINQARTLLLRALAVEPGQVETRVLLGRLYLSAGQTELARDMLESTLESGHRDPHVLAVMGIVHSPLPMEDTFSAIRDTLIDGSSDDLVERAQNLADDRPDDALAHNFLGLSWLSTGRSDRAIGSFLRATELDSENTEYRRNLALAHLGTSDPQSGLRVLGKERTLIEAEQSAAVRRALVVDQIRLEGTNAVLASSTALEYLIETPEDFGVRMLLAETYVMAGMFAEARDQYEVLLSQQWEDSALHNNLAWAYLQLGDKRAGAQAELAHELDPESASVADTFGWILVADGRVEEGLSFLSDAYLLRPGEPEIAYHYAFALAQTESGHQATTVLNRLLERNAGSVQEKAQALIRELTETQ